MENHEKGLIFLESFLIKGKCYNIKAMEFLADVQKRFPINGFYATYWCKLYVTRNKRRPEYLLVRKKSLNAYDPQIIKESEAKALLARYRYDIFVKRFGEMEVPA